MITPNKEQFRALAGKGNLIPVFREVVADMETPVSAYMKIVAGTGSKHSFLLESVEGGEKIARYSFLGVAPRAVFVQRDGEATLTDAKGATVLAEGADVFERLQRALEKYRPVEVPGMPPFPGGAVGYAAYDVVSEIEPTVPRPSVEPLDVPEALFMVTDCVLAFDKVRHTIKVMAQVFVESPAEAAAAYDQAVAKVDALVDLLKRPLSIPPVNLSGDEPELPFTSNKTPEQYKEMVRRGKEYILDGDIIQTVLSQRFEVELPVSPMAVYRSLRMVNPSPYMFLLDCGDFAIVGASPEVNSKCYDRLVTVRPIAGTRKRGKTEEEDERLAAELLADPKERAEHIMLVDLARNDVGRVSAPGSVRVDELMTVERYSHVMHIVSNVTGTLAAGLNADAVMRSTFPAGTLSGAPKVRAMQIICEQEGERRGPYGGVVAYYSFGGNVDSCITIRTAVLKDGKAYIQAGAGIVADSDPDTEYEETRSKARAMMKALSMARNFETV